ncbi:MAG TPA: cytochrome c [Rhizomicrobium sp.]|jgi:mono/diheme cytochrome c family protein
MTPRKPFSVLLFAGFSIVATPAFAQLGPQTLTQKGGEAIYKGVCQDCHMPDGKGAVGAAAYPALAGNKKLEEAGYPLSVVINGLHSMPSFAKSFDDQQVADIVNYIRTNFGNHYKGKVTSEQVKNAR